eukprot:gene3746-7436_t
MDVTETMKKSSASEKSSANTRLSPHKLPLNSFNLKLMSRLFFLGGLILWFCLISYVRAVSFSNPFLRGGLHHNPDLPTPVPRIGDILPNTKILQHKLNHAIIVPGHAAMRLSKQNVAAHDEDAWYLLPYQRGQGFPSIITSHIQKGLNLLENDDNSMLIFSGGQTRQDVGPISEAASYYFLASSQSWIHSDANRIFLEEYARDSFENLLFSLCRFREITGYYPSKISIVGFDFKSDRFTHLHRKAIGFPENNFTYYGIKPNLPFDQMKAELGEHMVLKSFANDMYGCHTPSLINKRSQRDPFSRTIPYLIACPELIKLLDWCGPDLFLDDLPWRNNNSDSNNHHNNKDHFQ